MDIIGIIFIGFIIFAAGKHFGWIDKYDFLKKLR